MVRFNFGTRRRTQIIVGTSKAKVTHTVITARPSVISIAETRSGVEKMPFHASNVQVPGTTPMNDKRAIASNGVKKKSVAALSTTMRNACSLRS